MEFTTTRGGERQLSHKRTYDANVVAGRAASCACDPARRQHDHRSLAHIVECSIELRNCVSGMLRSLFSQGNRDEAVAG